ncbi:hypothetical protein BLOT_014075 [Blomia tropicalis]|nr:hypothetical protein BLOT_014075 [Blomia tropicalis]
MSWLFRLFTISDHKKTYTESTNLNLTDFSTSSKSSFTFNENNRRIVTSDSSSPLVQYRRQFVISLTSKMLPLSVSGLGLQYQIPLLIGMFTLIWILLKTWRSIRERQIQIIPASWNGIHCHQWSLIQCLTHRATCCICRSLIVDAMYCDSCGVCLDFACYQNYVSRFGSLIRKKSLGRKASTVETLGQCKTVSTSRANSSDIAWTHQWIHGNLPAHSKCCICDQYCEDNDFGGSSSDQLDLTADHTLYHYRCCWCQLTVHEACYESNQSRLSGPTIRCKFGKWRRFILPPNCVIHKRVWSSRARGRAIVLEEIKDFRDSSMGQGPRDWEPLFVVANRKSGNNDAGQILSRFLTVLNPLQVIDLSKDANSLELALQICKMLPTGVLARFLVAGGDGTVGWVLNTIHKLEFETEPAVAILPLGTGNDLARVLGWNQETPPSSLILDRQDLIRSVYRAERIQLDRWMIDIRPSDYYHRSRSLLLSSLHIPKSIMPPGNRTLFMYNYFSVGVDALVALNFHEARKSKLYKFLFANTLINKFLYLTYGTKDLLDRRCKNLHTKIQLELDGVLQQLPELESIVLLNISSWGGGVKLSIPTDEYRFKQRPDDQLIEVFGLTSSFHIGQVMVGISSPIFLGQAKSVRLTLVEHLPVQVDGEPWLQSPAQIEINWNSYATVLNNTDSNNSINHVGDDGY